MLEVSVLASGSSGNCFYISDGKNDILFDAGISCLQIAKRLEHIGKSIDNIKALFVTHEHTDHIKGIETISKMHNIPVYINRGTLRNSFLDMGNVQLMETGEEINLEGLKIGSFLKSHDSAEPVGYLVSDNDKRISVLTDIGFCCENVINSVKQSDALILEANHDLHMLKQGSYPEHLKKRIASTVGHLSNYEAALLVLEHATKKLHHVLLSHLSENNNTPELALSTFNSIVAERSDLNHLKARLTFRDKPTELLRI